MSLQGLSWKGLSQTNNSDHTEALFQCKTQLDDNTQSRVGESGREELREARVLISRRSGSRGRVGSDSNPEPAKRSEGTKVLKESAASAGHQVGNELGVCSWRGPRKRGPEARRSRRCRARLGIQGPQRRAKGRAAPSPDVCFLPPSLVRVTLQGATRDPNWQACSLLTVFS